MDSENINRIRHHTFRIGIQTSSGIFKDMKMWTVFEPKIYENTTVGMITIHYDSGYWIIGSGALNIVKALRSQKYRKIAIDSVEEMEKEIPCTENVLYEKGKTVAMLWLSNNIRKK